MGMTATERKELRKLIDDEFASAKSFVRDLQEEAVRAATEEVEQQFASQRKSLDKLLEKMEAIENKAKQDVANVKTEIRKLGAVERYRGWGFENEEKQVEKVRLKIYADAEAANRELDRRRRGVEKDLILGSLETEDARKFVDSIPDISSIVTAGPLQKALQAAGK